MAATAEDLSSQAQVLQSSINFFKISNGPRRYVPPTAPKAQAPAKKAQPSSSLGNLRRAVKPGGVDIDLEASADSLDSEFTRY